MQTLLTAIYQHAAVAPSRPALLLAKQGMWTQLSYADLKDEVERWARFWLPYRTPQNDVVLLILPHRLELYPAFLGAMRAGLTPSFLPPPTSKQDPTLYWAAHKALFAHIRPRCILAFAEILPALGNAGCPEPCDIIDIDAIAWTQPGPDLPSLPEIVRGNRTALLQHSSGTTGLKKGVALTYEQIRQQVHSCAKAAGVSAEDRIISWLPLYHDMGLMAAFLMPLSLGALVISMDAFEWLGKPDWLLQEIARFRATLCWMPNFAFNHLARTRDPDRTYDLSSMRAFISCSEPCKPDTVSLFMRTFADHGLKPGAMQACYAMAEMVFAVTHTRPGDPPTVLEVDPVRLAADGDVVVVSPHHPDRTSLLSCGRPVDGAAVRIVPQSPHGTHRELPLSLFPAARETRRTAEDKVGEIEVAGSFLFDGYYKRPTPEAFSGAWFKTGDMGFLHDGELYVCGRIKEMLIVHGRNYYANDIEAAVNTVAGVKPGRVVAFGRYHAATASEEAMVIAETARADEDGRRALKEAIRQRVFDTLGLSLRSVELAAEGTLIKTTSGKLSRGENAKRAAAEVLA
jgi:acyl-CoA synthetase (AMP-forming)/AMP-acid ligase II